MQGSQQPPERGPDAPAVRFEAVVHPGERERSLERVADLDLDRVPDPDGGVRVLITSDEAEQLLDRGYEVRLVRAHRAQPLDRSLVEDEDASRAWLEDRTRGIGRESGS